MKYSHLPQLHALLDFNLQNLQLAKLLFTLAEDSGAVM